MNDAESAAYRRELAAESNARYVRLTFGRGVWAFTIDQTLYVSAEPTIHPSLLQAVTEFVDNPPSPVAVDKLHRWVVPGDSQCYMENRVDLSDSLLRLFADLVDTHCAQSSPNVHVNEVHRVRIVLAQDGLGVSLRLAVMVSPERNFPVAATCARIQTQLRMQFGTPEAPWVCETEIGAAGQPIFVAYAPIVPANPGPHLLNLPWNVAQYAMRRVAELAQDTAYERPDDPGAFL